MNDRGILERKHYDRVVCADGASVSIQAGSGIYSTPRDNEGPYTHVEAGFPSVEPPASWREYAEDFRVDDRLTLCDTVYAYMPYDCVDEFINVHGGLMEGFEFELPPRGDAGGDLNDAQVCLNCGSVLKLNDEHIADSFIISTLPRFNTAPTSPILWVRCKDCLACGLASAKKAARHIDDLPPRFQRDRDRGHFPTR